MKYPGIVELKNVGGVSRSGESANINGKWVPARPLGFRSLRYRLRATWLVFTGQCDALRWPEGQ